MSLKVIGAGVGRTGTTTLKVALEELGFNKCYHMMELLSDTSRFKYWKELEKNGTTNFEALFEGYTATVDYPSTTYYKILANVYPDARIILTEREEESWYQSTLNTIYKNVPKSIWQKLSMITKAITNPHIRKAAPVFRYIDQTLWHGYYEGRFEDKKFAISKYRAWNEEVRRVIPAERLLIFDPALGWEPLCAFLECPVPDKPFPKVNEGKNFDRKIQTYFKEGRIVP